MNCLNCKKETTNPKYCSRSCAAKKNNILSPKRLPEGKCKLCNNPIKTSHNYCKTCWEENKSKILATAKPKLISKIIVKNNNCKFCDKGILGCNQYCSSICHNKYLFLQRVKEIESTGFVYNHNHVANSLSAKRYMRYKFGDICSICKLNPVWNNKLLVLILDHIDGNCTNWKVTNLRLVCPNCDSQLSTFKSKNKNSKRTNRADR